MIAALSRGRERESAPALTSSPSPSAIQMGTTSPVFGVVGGAGASYQMPPPNHHYTHRYDTIRQTYLQQQQHQHQQTQRSKKIADHITVNTKTTSNNANKNNNINFATQQGNNNNSNSSHFKAKKSNASTCTPSLTTTTTSTRSTESLQRQPSEGPSHQQIDNTQEEQDHCRKIGGAHAAPAGNPSSSSSSLPAPFVARDRIRSVEEYEDGTGAGVMNYSDLSTSMNTIRGSLAKRD